MLEARHAHGAVSERDTLSRGASVRGRRQGRQVCGHGCSLMGELAARRDWGQRVVSRPVDE
ncbi:MAG: hypothetical protein ACO4BY_03910, partial [Candidatus Nanopelagicales bacterium]